MTSPDPTMIAFDEAVTWTVDEWRAYAKRLHGEWQEAARRGVEADAEIAQIRDALTGDDYASLPSDRPTVRMAHTIRADHDKFRNQVRDTCRRAETAEAALAAIKAAQPSHIGKCGKPCGELTLGNRGCGYPDCMPKPSAISDDRIDIVFDGPPSHESGRFVEVENAQGKSIKFGEWVQRPDGYWALRFSLAAAQEGK